MTVAVCTLGCTRKQNDIHSWSSLMDLEGDYRLYINWESDEIDDTRDVALKFDEAKTRYANEHDGNYPAIRMDVDVWQWKPLLSYESGIDIFSNGWKSKPKFDQDQARLASIVCARNMCVEYAMQTEASHLLFIDSDIIPPRDIIPRMLEVNRDAVCGLVYGRGIHSSCPYLFGEKRTWQENGYTLKEVEHANIGFTMLSKRLFHQVRFRYGITEYTDGTGRHHMISDDPAFHLDCFQKFGQWPVVRMDVKGQHVGNLDQTGVAQF